MSRFPSLRRHREVERIRGDLERDGFPRLQMLLLVALTGGAGFVASYMLLDAGMVVMWLRYLASFGFAYLSFLALLWLWLRTRAEDYVDVPDLSGSSPGSMPSGSPSPGGGGSGGSFAGEGGCSGGGGASASFDAAPAGDFAPIGDAGGSVGDALGAAAEADELAIPLFVLALAAAMACSSLYMVYSAPTLFAELVVDGVLSASLYRRLRGLETPHWLETAIRRTALPFALTAAIVSACGWGMALYAPGAHSLAEVVHHSKHAENQKP